MEKVRKPTYRIVYNGRNITADLTDSLKSISYSDKVASKSDSISIVVDDSDGRWRKDWTPEKGDTVDLSIGYVDALFPCGIFTVDQIVLSGPPHTVSIDALAAPMTAKLRTKRSYAHEGKTLMEIATSIAAEHGFTVQGEINSDFKIGRSTQHRETDLEYLRRLSMDFGYVFSVRESKLIFTSIYDLEGTDAITEIHRSGLTSYTIKDKTAGSYKSAKVSYHNPDDQQLVEGVATDDGVAAADVLEVRMKVENREQADQVARSVLHNAKTRKQILDFSVEGNVQLLAGVNFNLTGMGRLSGKYHITETTHSITPSGGFTTTGSAKKVAEIDESKWV